VCYTQVIAAGLSDHQKLRNGLTDESEDRKAGKRKHGHDGGIYIRDVGIERVMKSHQIRFYFTSPSRSTQAGSEYESQSFLSVELLLVKRMWGFISL
jgi:hypothetical protein